jgi:exodeoxyribonuclease VII large subunit
MAFEQLKQRLRAEGLFDEAFKIPLPAFPQTVGIVTSPTGAAIRDLTSILRRRCRRCALSCGPSKCRVRARRKTLRKPLRIQQFAEVDVSSSGRGGGSMEDLWAFNEEMVARAIFNSKIPVVSAVGHEIDFSISDFVADVRAATPSAAAELVAPDTAEVNRRLRHLLHKMQLHLQRFLQMQRERLHRYASSYGLRQPLDLVRQRSQQLDDLQRRLLLAMQNRLEAWKQELKAKKQRLQALSHQNILQRGFAIVYRKPAGELVREANQLAGDSAHIQLAVGSAEANVTRPLVGRISANLN